jgi:hypothetical protein
MKPLNFYAPYRTYDLTGCVVHKVDDPDGSSRIVAYYPKTYTKGTPVPVGVADGRTFEWAPYDVTEWTEVTLADIPKAAVPKT